MSSTGRLRALDRWAWAVLLLGNVSPAGAAGGKSIFKLGDYVDQKPFEVMLMYFTVFAVTIFYEHIVHHVNHAVTTHSGKNIVHHVYQEIMILGGISAILTVFENLGGDKLFQAVLFHYVHFVIFVMAVTFISLVGGLFTFIEFSWRVWSRFEYKVVEIENDPSLETITDALETVTESKSAFLQQYLKTVPNGQRMLTAIVFFRMTLPPDRRETSFTRYMKKQQRKLLLSFLHLDWRTFSALSALCTVAAVVTHLTLKISDNDLATIGLWVLFVGFGPLLGLVVIFFKIRREFESFTNRIQERKREEAIEGVHSAMDSTDHAKHFWRRSPHHMVFIMQTMLIYQVFYLANVFSNFAHRLWDGVGTPGIALLVVCIMPSVVVFLVIVPLSMPPFTILASLGEFVDHETLDRMSKSDELNGKRRRRALRQRSILEEAQFLHSGSNDLFGVSESGSGHHGHGHGEGLQLLSDDAGLTPLIDPSHHGHGHGGGHGDEKPPDVICEECDKSPAAVTCGICGILCENCSKNYHSFKKFETHHVIKLKNALFAPKQPLKTDNPIINKAHTAASLYKKSGAAEEVQAAQREARVKRKARVAH
eukprot:TRINITY_DN3820_c0_g2_i1.p1 TRINITY_DN3820_c0_g2~~TRINITY_DN3820_c0_g2_i1.p1  ORF type:complete len:616 (+),score=193.55 TRINITY_DN3820_c0_g2_i1:67-1848(+)